LVSDAVHSQDDDNQGDQEPHAGKQRDRNKLSGVGTLGGRRRDASDFRHYCSPNLGRQKTPAVAISNSHTAEFNCAFYLSANPPQGTDPRAVMDIIRPLAGF